MATYKNVQITGFGLRFVNETDTVNADGKPTKVENFELTCNPIKSKVLFKISDEEAWKTYADQTPNTDFSYEEISDPKYPTVKEVYLAQHKGQVILPEEEANLDSYDWKQDQTLGWYLDRDGSSEKIKNTDKLYPGDNDLTFKGNVLKLPKLHFVYGAGFTSEGNEICSTFFNPSTIASVPYPIIDSSEFKSGWGSPIVWDKELSDLQKQESDPTFEDDVTVTASATEAAKLSASISWVYGQYIYGDSYDGKMLTGNVWLKNPSQQKPSIIIEEYQSYIDTHKDEILTNPSINTVLYDEDKFDDVAWTAEYKLSDIHWSNDPNNIQDTIIELTGNVKTFTVTFRAFTDDIGSLLHVPDHVESDVAYGADLTYTEDDIYHNMLYDINEELANIGYPMSFIEDHPHWYINQNNTKINAMPYLSSVTSNLTVELSAKLNDQY